MKTKIYVNHSNIIAGITLKDEAEPEMGNMAIHACLSEENVIENRRKLSAFLPCSINDFVCSQQTHNSNFYRAESEDGGRGSVSMDNAIPDTDAFYTFGAGLLLCCFTADCVPVILYDETSGLTGVIHSGWQGTVKEITAKFLDHLIRNEKCDPGNFSVIIGPALSREKFEVDRDVADRFKALGYADDFILYNEKTRKYHIDNQLVVKTQCEMQGIETAQILMDRTCTFKSPDYFSFRQDRNCGRQMSFVIRRKPE